MLQLKFNFQIIAIAFACCFPSFLWAQLTTINNPSLQDELFFTKNNLDSKKNAAPSMENKQFQTANVASRSAAITINGGGVYCSGQTATLNVNGASSGTSIYWNTGDSTASISVSTSGKYWATTSNPSANTDTVTVIFADYQYNNVIWPTDNSGSGTALNGIASNCSTTKVFPGSNSITNYDVYSFYNAHDTTICVTAAAQTLCGNSQSYSVYNPIMVAAYLNYYNPSNGGLNYLADIGNSPLPFGTFGFSVPAKTSFDVMVYNVYPGYYCGGYSLYVDIPRVKDIIKTTGFLCKNNLVATAQPTASTYLWSNGATTQSINISSVGTYHCSVTYSNNCMEIDSVIVNDSFNPNVSNDVTINCINTDATLTASGGFSYLWSNGATTNSITVAPTFSRFYTVTITNIVGCSQIKSINVYVNNTPPLASITTDRVVVTCTNPSATLTATGGIKYEWNNGETTSAITVTPSAGSVNYTVTVTGVSGCTATSNQIIVVNKDIPTGMMPPNQTLGCGDTITTVSVTSVFPTNSSFLWNTGETTTTISVSYDSIAYVRYCTVTITGTNGCSLAQSSTVVFFDFNPNTIEDVTINCNSVATLSAQDYIYHFYLWNTGETTSSITVSPSSSQTYTVTITNSSGCSQIRSAKVFVNKVTPLANITTDRVVVTCTNPSATLTASGGIKYEWSNGATTSAITVSPSAGSVNYTVTVTGVSGCTATANQIIIVNKNVPVGNISANQNLWCGDTATTVTVSMYYPPNSSFLWNTGDTTNSIRVIYDSIPILKTYTVTLTNTNGCTSTRSSYVSFSDFNPKAIDDVTIDCKNTSAILTAQNGSNFQYLWNTGETTASITVSPSFSQTYTVTITHFFHQNCPQIRSAKVHVNKVSPLANITTNRVVVTCTNPSATLTATGGVKYEWNNGATTNAITVSPSAGSVNYTVTVTGVSGCTATANQIIIVNKDVPIATMPANQTLVCGDTITTVAVTHYSPNSSFLWNSGETTSSIIVNYDSVAYTRTCTVTITGVNGCSRSLSCTATFYDFNPKAIDDVTIDCKNTTATLTAQNDSYFQYLWNTGETTASITVSPSFSQTYTVTITDIFGHGCSQIRSAKVFVNKVTPLANITTDRVVVTCTNPSATLTATGGVKYEWNNGETTNAITVSPSAGSVNYTVTITGVSGCTATANQIIIVNKDVPLANAGPDVTIGCGTTSATLTASGGVSYLWNDGQTTASITVSPTTMKTYGVTVTGTNGCFTADYVNVFFNSNPPIANAGPDVTLGCGTTSATLTAVGGIGYLWSDGQTTASITVSPTMTKNYSVTVTAGNNCSAIDDVNVFVHNAPPIVSITTDRVVVTCTNPSATLTATGGVKYEWNNGETTNAITVSPSAGSVNYTVTVTNSGNCTATANQIIIANKNVPLANAGSDVTIGCTTPSVTLTASGGVSYLWNIGQTTASITVNPTMNKTYGVTVTGANGCFTADYVNVFYVPCSSRMNAKLFFQQMDINSLLMDSYLSTIANFPLNDPYNIAPLNTIFEHKNNQNPPPIPTSVMARTGADAIVDWVFIELRQGTNNGTTVAFTKAALLQRNGELVNSDGNKPLVFPNVPSGQYYVAIRHRNHLGFRTAQTHFLSNVPIELNFTNNSVNLFGSSPFILLNNNIRAMRAGDANSDGSIDAFDSIQWESENGLFDDYSKNSDYNLDGSIDAFDAVIWEFNNGTFEELD
jgi:hypothetical protein